MKHISLDLGDCIDNFIRKHYNSIAKRILPSYLETIGRHCILDLAKTLKTLDLSFMSLPADDTYLPDTYLPDTPDADFNDLPVCPGPTSQSLSRMKHNIGAIRIVSIGRSGPQNVLAALCSEIARENDWKEKLWTTWKG